MRSNVRVSGIHFLLITALVDLLLTAVAAGQWIEKTFILGHYWPQRHVAQV